MHIVRYGYRRIPDLIKYDLDIVFLGGLFPRETEADIRNASIGIIDNAANNLQWKLIHGLDANLESHVKILNSLFIGSYPTRYKHCFIKSYPFNHKDGASDLNAGFCNFLGIKHFSKYLSLTKHLKKWALEHCDKQKVVIAYALTNVFMELLAFLKCQNPTVLTVVIVPDLPQYMNTTSNQPAWIKPLKEASIMHIKTRVQKVDGFVLLTRYMADALKIQKTPYVIVEGIADPATEHLDTNPMNDAINSTTNIVYTGALNERYGILNLISAFSRINNPNYRLILCGAGDALPQIEEAILSDSRILYKGQLSRQEIIKIQNDATILVNPRQNNEEFTKYSFPSKIMEYLSSGRPVVAYKLDGIPDEYDKYIHYVPDNFMQTLADTIVKVCSLPEHQLREFGGVARQWVIHEKNAAIQARKILNMISEKLNKNNA